MPQEEVLQESYMMIPDSKGRLESAMSTLNQIMRVLLLMLLAIIAASNALVFLLC